MTAWSGWAGDLLHYLGFDNTSANLEFLRAWESREQNPCANNPIGASRPMGGSTLCGGGPKRNYRTRADGLTATAAQLHEGLYTVIYDALKSGNPYTFGNREGLILSLNKWGATAFASSLTTATTTGAAATKTPAPHAQEGWTAIMQAINRFRRQALQTKGDVAYAMWALGHHGKISH